MVYVCKNSEQGWSCPACGWGVRTTYIDEIYQDITEYSIFIQKVTNITQKKIKVISKIAGVNYLGAKRILENDDICILKAKAIDIKTAICELESANIPFEVRPEFKY